MIVSNGEYKISSSITVTNGIILTNLTGDPSTTIINAEKSANVFNIKNEAAVIAGFSIVSGAYANGAGVMLERGMVQNCWIHNNEAGGNGGGIWIYGSGTAAHCRIYNNTAITNGGGLCLIAAAVAQDCTIYNNQTLSYSGGGAHISGTSTILDCIISNNTANQTGGGVFLYRGGSVLKTIVVENQALSNKDGGGLYYYNGGYADECNISYNKALNGGGVCIVRDTGSYGFLVNSTINNNTAAGAGGGVYITGGIVSSATFIPILP